jgi:hypothetical protein
VALSRSRATRIGTGESTDGKTVRTRPAPLRFPRRLGSPQEPRHAPACGDISATTNVLENAAGQDEALAPFGSVRSGFSRRRVDYGVSDVSAGLGRRALLACSSKRWTGAQRRPRRTKMAGPARPVWGGRTRPLREDTPYRPCIDTTHPFGGAHPSNGTFFATGTRGQRHPERCPDPYASISPEYLVLLDALARRRRVACLGLLTGPLGRQATVCSQLHVVLKTKVALAGQNSRRRRCRHHQRQRQQQKYALHVFP